MRRGGEKETKEKFMTGRRRRDVLKGDNHFYDFVNDDFLKECVVIDKINKIKLKCK